ncbi:MAG TPA: hypothetical protein ENH82_13715 [bacterium]|nr:hypothetical protein [bacterium]
MEQIKDITKFWVDDDGYLTYGKGDDCVMVAHLRGEHVEAVSRLIDSHHTLLTACREVLSDFREWGEVLQTDDGGCYGNFSALGMIKQAITTAESN